MGRHIGMTMSVFNEPTRSTHELAAQVWYTQTSVDVRLACVAAFLFLLLGLLFLAAALASRRRRQPITVEELRVRTTSTA